MTTPYTTNADVLKLFARIPFDEQTKPTETQIDDIIVDTSAEIDIVLATAGYAVPPTGTLLAYVAVLCGYGVAAQVLKSAFPESTQSQNGGPVIPAYAFWEKRYQDGLKLLLTGDLIDPDAPISGSEASVRPSTYNTRNPDVEEAVGTIAEPMFTVRQVF